MNLMLTDPDVLADYVNDFFGLKVLIRLTNEKTELAVQAREQFEQEILAQAEQVPQNFQRPAMDMPTPGRPEPANDFWGGFSQMMDAPRGCMESPVPGSCSRLPAEDAGPGPLIHS